MWRATNKRTCPVAGWINKSSWFSTRRTLTHGGFLGIERKHGLTFSRTPTTTNNRGGQKKYVRVRFKTIVLLFTIRTNGNEPDPPHIIKSFPMKTRAQNITAGVVLFVRRRNLLSPPPSPRRLHYSPQQSRYNILFGVGQWPCIVLYGNFGWRAYTPVHVAFKVVMFHARVNVSHQSLRSFHASPYVSSDDTGIRD